MKTDTRAPHGIPGEKMPLLLSKLWVFLSLCYIYCDVLSNMETATITGLLEGSIAGIPMTEGFLLLAGISLTVPFLMVVLSAFLPRKVNRPLNMGAAILMILYQVSSFFIGSGSTPHYVFFSAMEIIGNCTILLLAARWKRV
jgi:hypothetical protein